MKDCALLLQFFNLVSVLAVYVGQWVAGLIVRFLVCEYAVGILVSFEACMAGGREGMTYRCCS